MRGIAHHPDRMGDVAGILHHAIEQSRALLTTLGELEEPLQRATDALAQTLATGGKLLVCGNGGSAADAAHFATEFVVRFIEDRPAYPAICLTSDGGLLSAAGNDYGFEEIFARQVAALGKAGDLLLCLTTSGNSRNVQRALEEAKNRGLHTIALLGRDGGASKGLADTEILVPGPSTARIQEAQMFLLHVLCEATEKRLAARRD